MRRHYGFVIGALLLSGCATVPFPAAPLSVWGYTMTHPDATFSAIAWARTEQNCQTRLAYAKRERITEVLGTCRPLTLSSGGEQWGYAYSASQNYGTDYGMVFSQKATCARRWTEWAGVLSLTDCSPVTLK